MQIPFSRVTRIYIPILLKFVSQQSGFAFFGAYDFGCAHFFYLCKFWEEKKNEETYGRYFNNFAYRKQRFV